MLATLDRFLRDETGTTTLEYSLIVALAAAAVIVSLKSIDTELEFALGRITGEPRNHGLTDGGD